MELFIDVGNSRLKWAQREKNALSPIQAINYQSFDFIGILEQFWKDLTTPSNVYISNVGKPDLNGLLSEWCEKVWDISPIFAQTNKKNCDILNGYENIQTLGIDRWLALIGSKPYLSENLCVVDCGTAVTIDVLQINGLHLGGLILAGLQTSRDALTQKAAALKNIQFNQDVKDLNLAKNTHDGIALGTIYAVAGCIEKVAATHQAKVILTGGDAIFIIPHLKCHFLHLPDLVLQGLTRWADEQKL
jgi:type III pantothenate kinase